MTRSATPRLSPLSDRLFEVRLGPVVIGTVQHYIDRWLASPTGSRSGIPAATKRDAIDLLVDAHEKENG